ncbi:MAG: M14 family zinc carboxypeptidase [Gemmatimonadota bacterium]
MPARRLEPPAGRPRPGVLGLLVAAVLLTVAGVRPAGAQDYRSRAEEVAAAEQDPFDFRAYGPYRDDVPQPRDVLGYPPGSVHTPHARMLDYFRALAEAAPDRITLERYGQSYERQELILAFVGSEENLERREEIRRSIQRLTEPRGTTEETAAGIASETPVIVWLDYANDGNETANLEAAMQVAYQLVAGESEEMRRFRSEALVILNPDHNPESHDRHVFWYNAFGTGAADPAALEHDAPWGMSTNNNHYQIDLNRDAWGLTQMESQTLAARVLRWRPQVFVDHHGQTEQYFFPPPVRPVNPELPETHRRWYEVFGRGNAEAFDDEGWQYYVRDVFDLYYPGYWDTWPALHGAIGMTYETDGGGYKGLRWRRQDGTILTFRDGIAHHFTASLSTVRTAVENREELLGDFAAYFRGAVERGRDGDPARAYALTPGDDPRAAAVLVGTLLRHGVEVRRARASFQAGGRHHQSGEAGIREYPAGTYLVDMAQPDGRAAATYLRADSPLDSVFVREQVAAWSRNARRGEAAPTEGYEFYDVTAWSLPLAMGVDAYGLDDVPDVETAPVTGSPEAIAGTGYWEDEIPFAVEALGGGITDEIGEGAGTGAGSIRARSSYLYEPGREGALRLTSALMREGYRVAVATRPLRVLDRAFPRGTFVVRVSRNPESVHERIDALAREAGVEVAAAHTAFPSSGATGPGSNDVPGLREPRIAVAAGEGVDVTSYGAVWFTLERRLGHPFTPLRIDRLGSVDLDRFDVLVIPDASAGALREALGQEGHERLAGWLERGGTLVGWEGTAAWAVDAELVDASLVRREAAGEAATDSLLPRERLDQIEALPQAAEPRPPAISPSARPGALQPLSGAVLRAEIDRTHWLTQGLEEPDLPVLARGDDFLTLSRSGSNPVVFPDEGPLHLAGFVWPGNTERLLGGTAHSVVESVGGGQVILFGVDPNFRLVWRSTARLFGNAVLLGPTLGTRGQAGY